MLFLFILAVAAGLGMMGIHRNVIHPKFGNFILLGTILIESEVTEHTIHRDWCGNCRKRVEPTVPDALPGATLGNHVLVISAWRWA